MYRRPANDSSTESELLVFGYACKLFREDEGAAAQERDTQQLIPWMGDSSIMIDRYDGRGHLHDLSEYDSGCWNHDYQLSEEEARIEALCDEERYLALHTDLLEEEARQEEEYKRLSEALAEDSNYSAVSFSYSTDYYDPSQPTEEEEGSKDTGLDSEPQDCEEPFVAPPGLDVPADVELPATSKTHAIIERTASFVCKQGAQFEIVLKAKQSQNSQFDFLRFDHYLNPYYRHILRAMKEGRYTHGSAPQPQEEESVSDMSDEDDDGSYLHPSLFASKKNSRLEELMKPLQVMDPDHPLAALVKKVQQDQSMAAGQPAAPTAVPDPEASADISAPPLYYSYCMLPDGTYCLAPPPTSMDTSTFYRSMATPTPASAMPSLAPPTSEANTAATTESSRLSVAAAIIPPPPDVQPVIDKLAEYVARNGIKFEASVRAKNDPRFDFLQPWNQYNTYYEFKKNYFMQKEGVYLQQTLSAGSVQNTDLSGSELRTPDGNLIKASSAPISFAIRAKENDLLPLEKNRVRLDDDSDDEQSKGAGQVGVSLSGTTLIAGEIPLTILPLEEKKPALTPEELEAKQAKQKLEDRLAAAAREKLAQASKECKEKQLQAERKRKAALFLQTLRGSDDTQNQNEQSEATPTLVAPQIGQRVSLLPGDGSVLDNRSRDTVSYSTASSSSSHHQPERRRKKHKHRSRSPSRSPTRSKHSLPSAYRVRRSRSRSRTPKRRERRRDERDVYIPPTCRHSNSPSYSRRRSRSRSPQDKRKKSYRSYTRSPASPPSQTTDKKHQSAIPAPSQSTVSRGAVQDKDKQVASAIVSSVQNKITQDLMAKVRAMLAASKDLQTSTT